MKQISFIDGGLFNTEINIGINIPSYEAGHPKSFGRLVVPFRKQPFRKMSSKKRSFETCRFLMLL